MSRNQIYYSDRYNDEHYEYRHVVLPREMAKYVPRLHLMSEGEWRQLGVQQSQGWIHYMIHEPEDLYQSSNVSVLNLDPSTQPVVTEESYLHSPKVLFKVEDGTQKGGRCIG